MTFGNLPFSLTLPTVFGVFRRVNLPVPFKHRQNVTTLAGCLFLAFFGATSRDVKAATITLVEAKAPQPLLTRRPQIALLSKPANPQSLMQEFLIADQTLTPLEKQSFYKGFLTATFILADRRYSIAFSRFKKFQLWFDSDGDKVLDKSALPLSSKSIKPDDNSTICRFEAVIFQLRLAPQATYRAVIEISQATKWTLNGTTTQWQAKLYSVGFQKGTLNFAGHTYRVGVQDNNSNGRYNDLFHYNVVPTPEDVFCDVFLCDQNNDGDFYDAEENMPLGRLIYWNKQITSLTIATDGSKLSANFYKGRMGLLRVEPEISALSLVSNAGFLMARPSAGEVLLPQGQYFLMTWTANRSLSGRNWTLRAAPAHPPAFSISTAPVEKSLLSPLIAFLQAERYHDKIIFALTLGTANGDVVLALKENNTQASVQLRLLDLENNPWARLKLTAKENATFEAHWKPPTNTPLRLITRLEFDVGPFQTQAVPDAELALAAPTP